MTDNRFVGHGNGMTSYGDLSHDPYVYERQDEHPRLGFHLKEQMRLMYGIEEAKKVSVTFLLQSRLTRNCTHGLPSTSEDNNGMTLFPRETSAPRPHFQPKR